jgi:TldD protein
LRERLFLYQDLVNYAVEEARVKGAEYAESRYQKTSAVACLLRDGVPEPAIMADAEGIGIRLIFDGMLAFAATNDATRDSVRSLIDTIISSAKGASSFSTEKIRFSGEDAHVEKWAAEENKKLEDVSVESMISFLKEIDSTLKDPIKDVSFAHRMLNLGYNIEEKIYANSDGSKLEGRIPRVHYSCLLTAFYSGATTTVSVPPGYAALGGSGGWELVEQLDLLHRIPLEAEELTAGIKASEKPPTDENIDVILGPNVAGLTSHESCGHPGEADRILGREGAQAGESFLKDDALGMQIGSSEAYVSDDPTIPHSMGFYVYDDEGVRARKRGLIVAGKFAEFLQNRATAAHFGIKSNASSRAVRFDREPIIRMGNTFIEPGDRTFDEMLKEVKKGIYIKSFMEWNIDDKRLNQRYVGLEAYSIENGQLKEAVRYPVLEIATPKYWSSIDARGKDLQFTCGTCGKGDPMQGAPVFIGAPHIRLRGVRVGAR